jgi:hypothetical protein
MSSKLVEAINARSNNGLSYLVDKVKDTYSTAKDVVSGHLALQSPVRIVPEKERKAAEQAKFDKMIANMDPHALCLLQSIIHKAINEATKKGA